MLRIDQCQCSGSILKIWLFLTAVPLLLVSTVKYSHLLCLHDGQWSETAPWPRPAFIVQIITEEDSDQIFYTHVAYISLSRDNRL